MNRAPIVARRQGCQTISLREAFGASTIGSMPFGKIFSGGPRFAAEWLVVGLGNPDLEHAQNRHNAGFRVIGELAKRAGAQLKAQGSLMQIGLGTLADQKVALVKPKTYYNASGKAVMQALSWTGCDLAHTIVIYDELDLAAGAIRIRAGGGHGGNNGIRSISQAVGPDFIRIRIGIGRPLHNGEPTWDSELVAAWVLGNPREEDRQLLDEAIAIAAGAVESIMTEGPDIAGSKFNRR